MIEIPLRSDGAVNSKAISNDLFLEIVNLTPFVKDTSRKSIQERVFCILNNIVSIPKCQCFDGCTNPTNFLKKNLGYARFCSNSCSAKRKDKFIDTRLSMSRKEKYEQTCLERYGVSSHNSLNSIKEKKIDTYIKKYGEDNPAKSKTVKDKISVALAQNFQKRKNCFDEDYSGVVYILHFEKLHSVKIGLTGNFEKRSKDLFATFGEFKIIDVIETSECFKLESQLHEKFKDYRLCLDKGSGRTEFFFDEILSML